MTPRTKQQISDIVAPLSPMAARILCVLFLSAPGQSYTSKTLAAMLGKSENTIAPAVEQLQFRGLIQHNGKNYGWSLIPALHQLSLPGVDSSTEHNKIQIFLDDPNIFGLTPSLVSSSTCIDKESLLTTTNAAVSPKIFGLTQEPVEGGPENTVPVRPENTVPDDPETTEVASWLLRGGIAPGSAKMKTLLEAGFSAEYAKAHVLEHLHEAKTWERERVGRKPGTGTLIYRLERGWPSPTMRCEACLRVERECHCDGRALRNQIPDRYKDIIKR